MNNHTAQANGENKDEHTFFNEVLISLSFFSRLPIKAAPQNSRLAEVCRGFGVAGLILGAISGLTLVIATGLGLGTYPSVIVALALSALVTGGLHEDGLADVADGFGGGWTKERKLEIMRDSQIGTYGVLALVFSTAFRIVAYGEILQNVNSVFSIILLFAALGCISRAPMALMMYKTPLARSDGQAAQAGAPSHDKVRQSLIINGLVSAVCFFIATNLAAVLAVFVGVAIAFYAVDRLAKAQIGGHTGDVLGTLQQAGEFAGLFALLCLV